MRPAIRFVLAALCVGLTASTARAQTELVSLEKVHQLFSSGQSRQAARELGAVSIAFRGEISRCRDENLGAQLMQLEPRIDALVRGLGAGTVTSVAALEQEFLTIDRLLAENHQQLAETGWGLRRFGGLEQVATDLSLAAGYLERSARWAKAPLSEPARKAATDARAMASRIAASPANPPAEAGTVITALGVALKESK
jgi:hypothetical protein